MNEYWYKRIKREAEQFFEEGATSRAVRETLMDKLKYSGVENPNRLITRVMLEVLIKQFFRRILRIRK